MIPYLAALNRLVAVFERLRIGELRRA